MTWLYSVGAVYVFMFFCGWLISWISGFMQCGKTGIGENAKQGAIWGTYPTIVYALSTYIDKVRNPFANTLTGFGVPATMKDILGVGYLVMLSIWIATVWNIHNTTKSVCNPSVNEMAKFKENLLKKLEQEANEKKENVEKPAEVTKTSMA